MPEQQQIVHAPILPVPNDYLLADNVEILLYVVNANFTDDGAGTDWLPAVVLLSDSNHVIARALLPDVKVTAGDDAEVSWFPGVKPGGGATVASHIAQIVTDSVPTSGSDFVFTPMTFASFTTDDPANFVQVSSTQFTGPTVDTWLFMRAVSDAGLTTPLNGNVRFVIAPGFGGPIGITAANGETVGILTSGGGVPSPGLSGNTTIGIAGTDSHNWTVFAEVMAVY